MTEPSFPLTALSEAQRTQALERFAFIRPALEGHVSQTQQAREHQIPLSTMQRWIKQYREKGLAGLANTGRSDKGKSRSLPEQAIQLIEGLALQTPPRFSCCYSSPSHCHCERTGSPASPGQGNVV